MRDTLEFMTIRETAATGILSEHQLRLMKKQNQLPGIYTGNRFLVNYQMLVERLNAECAENVEGG